MSDNRDSGFICLYRSLLDWEWYNDVIVTKLFIHLLLKANHTEKQWKGILIPRGSLITSYHNLSEESGLSVKQVRDAISKLIRTNEVAKKSTTKYSLITLINYDKYQDKGKQTGKQKASKGQTKGNKQQLNNENNVTNNNSAVAEKNQDAGDYVFIPDYPRGGNF